MYIEYACYDEIRPDQVRINAFKAIEYEVDGLSLPLVHLSTVSPFLPKGMILSCPIDYPNGFGDIDLRIHYALRAFHYGANTLDITANIFMYYDVKSEFIADIKALMDLCRDKKMTARFMVDYRKLVDQNDFYAILTCLRDQGVEYVFSSTGMYTENISDNIAMNGAAQNLYGMKGISNGNFYLREHLEKAKNAGIYGLRFNNIYAVERCLSGV